MSGNYWIDDYSISLLPDIVSLTTQDKNWLPDKIEGVLVLGDPEPPVFSLDDFQGGVFEKDYFITSRKIGLSFWKLLFKEIFPVLVISLTVAIVFQFSNVILAESSLSYLGLGVGINYPSWGNMILSGQKYMTTAWWMLIVPSVILVLVLLSINSFGEKIKKIINPTIVDD